jgi:uncharacterized protein YdaU (DUF1376 family)
MSIQKKAESAVGQLENLLAEHWTTEQEIAARKIIENVMGQAIKEACAVSKKVVTECCSADQDMAHKLNEEIKLARKALIANLNSLR